MNEWSIPLFREVDDQDGRQQHVHIQQQSITNCQFHLLHTILFTFKHQNSDIGNVSTTIIHDIIVNINGDIVVQTIVFN
jgi:hypothetical protein